MTRLSYPPTQAINPNYLSSGGRYKTDCFNLSGRIQCADRVVIIRDGIETELTTRELAAIVAGLETSAAPSVTLTGKHETGGAA